MKMARIGLWINEQAAEFRRSRGWNVFAGYTEEMLQHRGIAYSRVSSPDEFTTERYDMLIVAFADEMGEDPDAVFRFAEQGGHVIALGNLNRLSTCLGCTVVAGSRSEYAELSPAMVPFIQPERSRLRFAESSPWAVNIKDGSPLVQTYGNLPGGKLILQLRAGEGRFDRFAVDVADTIVKLQQGDKPVFEDGIPAPDGTAAVNDGVLKADDVTLMDWDQDRMSTASGVPFFAYPYADWWRELFCGYIIHSAWEMGFTVPFVGYWPDGVRHVAHLSHDSDYNQDEHAITTLELLKEQDIRSTWCMLEPGYARDVYRRVSEDGHELAFHYNAVHADNGFWDEQEFMRQFRWLQQATGIREFTTNKNHLTRVEGWGELFRWCEQAGIQSDQTRGPSKKGNLGFLFGTCHPYFPVSWADEGNRRYDVLQVGFLTPDMNTGKWSDDALIDPLLERVARSEGVAHFLFHQIHLHTQEEVRYAFRLWIEKARERGFTFMKNREINDWERKKRKLTLVSIGGSGEPVTDNAGSASGAVVWLPVPKDEAHPVDLVYHYGVPCRRNVV